MEPAVWLKRIEPFPFSVALNATASISMTDPIKPATPRPKILPTSVLSDAFFRDKW